MAAAYVVAALLGVRLAQGTAPVTSVWPASGVALAGLLVLGIRLWPAVWLGSLTTTLVTGGSLTAALAVSTGATIEAAGAAWLLGLPRLSFRNDLARVRAVLAFVVVASVCAIPAATIGAASVAIHRHLAAAATWHVWTTWWVGDALGTLLVAPLLLSWLAEPHVSRQRLNSAEAALAGVSAIGVAWLSFSGAVPVSFLVAPVVIWASLRLGQRGATTVTTVISVVAIWNTVRGHGPFASFPVESALLLLQVFTFVVAMTALFLGAVAAERELTQRALRDAHEELERRVADRTSMLSEANRNLAVELTERHRAEEERRRLEAHVLQAQKLESLGLLAGGIAHDFNNLLTVILGQADLALSNPSTDAGARASLAEIKQASRRAADLASQMLAYSGRIQFVIEPVDLSELVAEMKHLLQASISKKARLVWQLADGLPTVNTDPTQVQQVLMNLVINASEAIGEQDGLIRVSTAAVSADELSFGDDWACKPAASSTYVSLEVTDTGKGMGADALPRIFDPFYSTKFSGRGLGLATVLGIVRGHEGGLKVDSAVGAGTAFTILFAAAGRPAAVGPGDARDPAAPWTGTGTVLVVDDESAVRSLAAAMVQRCGFQTLTAEDGDDALAVFREHDGRFTCVLLDMTMPRKGGEDTLREIRALRPGMPVILSSGYPEPDVIRRTGGAQTSFIQKPYTLAALRAALQVATGGAIVSTGR